ncbi:DUF2130 domain-containing protein [Campylobacter blaseri]|uniref:Caldesmon n=1 Tax=Campylobacter blaseri TaxID=2042961 RepID=A0A2P8R456_9BACT|nr:DUF2130 domain-containing protein [Campylobacter blaseri]PSM53259.1 Caldesmon [Campylobacter blaseri]PSM54725.1 Caldesmon [Campylobacter blaseri]QKF86792.1 DUF2130 domain-containing protein [Campylobacter blaseri]
MEKQASIKCPNCGELIDINELLYHQLESEFRQKTSQEKKKFEDELNKKRGEYKEAFAKLKEQEQSVKEQKEKFLEELEKATKQRLKLEKQKLSEELKKEILEEQSESMNLLKKELEEKSNQVKELNKSKAEIEKLKREKDEMESKLKANIEMEFSKQLSEEKAKIQKSIDEQNELKFRQKEEQLEQLRKQLLEAQRKAEQGSQQLQGEVQELAIEEYLSAKYPFDNIEEIKKGARGGDCVQIVHTREFQNCGKIYYESKRAKDFQRAWIEKFKADMREKGADIGVLVTEVLPKELDRMGLIDGVWVCTFEEFKGLCGVLREGIIRVYLAKKSGENKTDKMSLLYGYLTSNEFKMQIEAIVEGFTQMQSDLDSEKRAMQRIWKQREKQIEKVLENTIGMYSSIKGIAGNSIGSVKALELPYSEEAEELEE